MHVFIDCSLIEINTPVFFLGKCVRTVAKAMFVHRIKTTTKKQLYYIWRRDSCQMLQSQGCADFEMAAEHHKDDVLEGKACNLNFLPSTKKTTEYSLELFLSIYRY